MAQAEKDQFDKQLEEFLESRETPIKKLPTISGNDIELYKLFKVVKKLGGYNKVTSHTQWVQVADEMDISQPSISVANQVKLAYKRYLLSYEDFRHQCGGGGERESGRRPKNKPILGREKKGEVPGRLDDWKVVFGKSEEKSANKKAELNGPTTSDDESPDIRARNVTDDK